MKGWNEFSLLFIITTVIYSRAANIPQEESVDVDSSETDSNAESDIEDYSEEYSAEARRHGRIAPKEWLEHWADIDLHKENLSRVYIDDHVSFEYDSDVNKSITWPFKPISTTWEYIKETYGPFGPDPHLYVVLHASKYEGCLVSTFWMKHYEFRNVIDCSTLESDGWSNNSSFHLETLLTAMGHVIRNGAKGVDNIADALYCSTGMVKILVYDLYTNLKGRQHTDVVTWTKRQFNETGCFTNWALPIYKQYGGASVINNFYNYTFMYWPQASEGGYEDYMNTGEWIHFWSGAADADLFPLGNSTIGWENWVEEELVQARKDYPHFNYSTSDLDLEEEKGGLLKYVVIAILVFIFVAVFLGGGILAIHRKMN